MTRPSKRQILVALAIAAVVTGGLVVAVWGTCAFRGCPDLDQLRGYVPEQASIVVGREGIELAKLYKVRRVVVPIDSLPDYVPEAFIAIEDDRFYEHDGVDWRRMVGAAWVNLTNWSFDEGFSTITMQLARNLFPEKLPAHKETIQRKLAEMIVAFEMEDRYSKKRILGLYLNFIYYGGGAWGIEAASLEYFGKHASELKLAEAATLAALPVAPSNLNPRVNPDGARARRDIVLRKMAKQGRVPAERAEKAMDQPLGLAESRRGEEELAPYFVEAVRLRLEERFGPTLYTGGYTIHTTLDADVQRIAEAELEQQLDDIEVGAYGSYPHPGYPGAATASAEGATDYLQGAVVVMEAESGNVRAMVGGRDFGDSPYNRATQAARQPGSAFKPVVYAAAVAAGYPLTTRLRDRPIRVVMGSGNPWTPENYGGGYRGVTTMRQALVNSRNVPTVRLALQVGLDPIVEMAHRLGIDDVPHVPAIALGAAEVTLLELVEAYAAFATLGTRPEPRLVTHVEDANGKTVWRNPPVSERVLDPAVAFLITDVLRDVVNRGTAWSVRASGYRGVAAGKTGTTDQSTDVWFMGYTPERVTGVWIGLDEPQRIKYGATGGGLAAPVWADIMRRIGAGTGAGWSPPPGVVSRPVTGHGYVLEEGCRTFSETRTEYFLRGTAPVVGCPEGWWFRDDDLAGRPYGFPSDSLYGEDPGWWDRLWDGWFGDDEDADPRGRLDGDFGDGRRDDGLEPDSAMPPTDSDTAAPRLELDSLPSLPPDTVRDTTGTAGGGAGTGDEDPPDLLGEPANEVSGGG